MTEVKAGHQTKTLESLGRSKLWFPGEMPYSHCMEKTARKIVQLSKKDMYHQNIFNCMDTALANLKNELQALQDPETAKTLSRFFKTGDGQYGEGDIFLGIKVPEQRRIAKKYSGMDLDDINQLLKSEIHEYRLISLFILILKYKKEDTVGKQKIIELYLNTMEYVNNWDLVDSSAPYLLGDFLLEKDKSILYRLAESGNLWERRIAILSTFAFIKNNEFEDALNISEILISDYHDLIHKAVGWMLREIGKRDVQTEESFLRKHCKNMPRTMLRYAIEKFDDDKRKFYLGRKYNKFIRNRLREKT